MFNALEDAKVTSGSIDYVNAHAPSTPIGDASEMKALKSVFNESQSVMVSSTKALTGHGLSLQYYGSGVLLLGTERGFHSGSANVSDPDPEMGHLNLLHETLNQQANRILSNSSGFGGANVSLIFDKI